MDDLISRNAVIAEFSCCELTPDGGIDVNYAIDFLKQLPTAQPTQTNASNTLKALDCVSRQAAIDATWFEPYYTDPLNVLTEVRDRLEALPSAREKLDENDMPEQGDSAKFGVKTGETCTDCISRQAAIEALACLDDYEEEAIEALRKLPSAQPTLYGYSIEHLALIAIVMQKKNVTPEEAIECFKNITDIVQMYIDEQKEIIKRAVEGYEG